MEMNKLLEEYGCLTFSDDVMRERIPKSTYKAFHEALAKGEPLAKETATVIANAMKIWAVENGATHFTHWFTPMTGLTAEKHDAFLEPDGNKAVLEFSGKTLRKGEPDASSFPSGGLRATFEARGYTAWDCTSPAFVKDESLYIPTLFCSYTGEALDKKTPLLKSVDALTKASCHLLPLLGMEGITRVSASVGSEQEYFLVADEFYQKRMDLKLTGRTLFGAMAPKGQELEDHYFGSLKRKVSAFMKDLDKELWRYGIPSKTKHNEAAPAQHEVACVYRKVNITTDNNHLLMQLMQDIAKKHGLRCLLHEKPFAGVNGSGKHNNWSVVTNTGVNLFDPGDNPVDNLPFLATLACTIKAVDEYADLLRMTIATAGNDHRLGANEAPPAIISMFLGEELDHIIESITDRKELEDTSSERFQTGVSVIPDFSKDNTDRNRTSPFAFTGNKFEFRGVGSSQSIAGPNTILNAILAAEMEEMADLIESGKTPMEVIKDFMAEHKRIIFNGDGYSAEWEAEAQRRGLPNRKNTVDAMLCLKDEKNIEMLSRLGIYSEVELDSRYEILLDNYNKTIQVEALTASKMARNEIYPAAIQYLSDITKTALEVKQAGVNNEFLMEDVQYLSELLAEMKKKMDELDSFIKEAQDCHQDILQQSILWRDHVFAAMNSLRETVDVIETRVDAKYWPIPTYLDLLFGI
ncbi:MAG: glutamine synthetase III [Longibaculum muris]|uniref:Glutamine synthetase n=1 Tax=Longibaculum muris TaxID=1796628 RepID=A0A4R3Z365_9FIRM|nr:glutamine synthetase III [Longibaculum muris]KXU42401.1 glutamate--ammonia ligase, catalytic domain protein [Candidatus Stoquefichus sp. KLE1796]MBS5370633.1 glutamine synthetase III [Coprobacillus cateniformis]MCR1888725.1 glutamine synthetase III [Longibaculum muris]MED9811199.1 glutamine synthetase III [Longibaculum muris]TCV99569.1 glutamine synthetase [Longibaculum muris]